MVFRWFLDFIGRWLTMVWKITSYKKCVNSTRDKACARNTGERITAPDSFRNLRAIKEGPTETQFFKKLVPSPKQGPKNAHLVEYLDMGTRVLLQIETHRGT